MGFKLNQRTLGGGCHPNEYPSGLSRGGCAVVKMMMPYNTETNTPIRYDDGGGVVVTWRLSHNRGDKMVVRGVLMVVLMVWWLRCADDSDDEDGGDEWLGDTDGKADHGGGVRGDMAAGDVGEVVVWAVETVAARGVGDRIDRVTGNIFRFAENDRRKSFQAAAAENGGGWPAVGRKHREREREICGGVCIL
nr:hypothetical protein [Tanacetum cinerariifolium]